MGGHLYTPHPDTVRPKNMHKYNKNKQCDTTNSKHSKLTVRKEVHATPTAPTRYGEVYHAWDEAPPSVQTTETSTLVATSDVDTASSTDVATVATANDANLVVEIFYARKHSNGENP